MSMSQYILREVGGSQEGPSLREVLARIAAQPERRLTRPAAELVREARESPAQPQASRNLDSWNGSLHS